MENLEFMRRVNPDFWKQKRVFLTGHTGFKGGWLSIWLNQMGATVYGYSLAPNSEPNLYNVCQISTLFESEFGDIRDQQALSSAITNFRPDVVIHMAAQPIVRVAYANPIDTLTTNVIGTANVLEAARHCESIRAIISVTTDKCYENKEWEWGYRENEPLGGHDPYSSSKACAELVTSSFHKSYFYHQSVGVATVRAGNVIGGGDWAQDRLIPDVLRAFEKAEPVIVRNPEATRPWQHVLEPLSGYLMLAENLYSDHKTYSEPWNFGPEDGDCQSVEWILKAMTQSLGEKAKWHIDKELSPHEAQMLKLDCSKAKKRLGWRPKWNIAETLNRICFWHSSWVAGEDMLQCCLNEIKNYNE